MIWGGASAAVLTVLLGALVVLLPWVVDTEAIGRSISAALEARYRVRSERVEITVLPYPRVVLHGTRVTVPEILTASAESVAIVPRILPLITGRFAPAEVDFRSPRVTARLPEQPLAEESEPPARKAHQNVQRLKDKLAQLQAMVQGALPGIVADVDDGSLEIYSGRERVFSFQEIDLRATVHAHGVDLELSSGKSGLWDALTITGWFDAGSWKGRGEINLTGGAPQSLLRYLFPASSFRTADSQLDLTVNVSTDGPGNARAEFTAAVPQITVANGAESRVLQNGSIAGTLRAGGEGMDVELSRCRFDSPRASLTGRYSEKFTSQDCSLEIEAREVDVAAARDVALALGKENRVVQRIFEIVRAGDVPSIVFSAHAKSRAGLKQHENYTIQGRMERGTILAPKVELLVSNAWGDVVVANGVLDGTNLAGTTAAGSSTTNGVLKVGLIKEDPTFHLDLPLKAELSELPEILARVVPNAIFKREMGLLKDVKGKTEGRLLLGESLDDVNVKVETGPYRLSGRYDRLPDPVELAGPAFSLEGSHLSVSSVAGTSGKTKFSELGFSYDWEEGNVIELNTRSALVVSIDLLGVILKVNEDWKKALNISTPKGVVHFDWIDFRGPVGEHSKWVFKAGGMVDNLTVNTEILPHPITLKTGKFDIARDVIGLKDVSATLADSTMLVTGKVNGFFENLHSLDLFISGHFGPQGNRDIATIAALPLSMRAIANLTVNSSHLVWEKDTRTAFTGELNLASGPRVKIDLVRTPKEIENCELAIKDPDSDATIGVKTGENRIEVQFSGLLSNKTADKLLAENTQFTGPIRGDFKADLFLETPKKSTAQGQLTISGFQLPIKLRVPARIETATLEADGNRINVKSAMVSWNGSRLSFGGGIEMTESAYVVDMNAFADSLDLEKIIGEKREEAAQGASEVSADSPEQKKMKTWDAPVHGTIRVRSESLSYGRLRWNPVGADVVISPGLVDVKVHQANFCGVSTPGKVIVSPDGFRMLLTPRAKDQDLQATLECLLGKGNLLTGKFDLKGNLSGGNKGPAVMESLEGDVEFTAKDGRIYRWSTFAKIISLLSITEVYRGVLPDIFSEGCAYSLLTAKGKIKDGKLTVSESLLDGPCVKMVFRGEINLVNGKLDMVALVTPLRTVDRIIGAVPILGKLLDGVFFSVPVQITGDISDPTIIPLSPSAVGAELLGFMKRTFRLPLTLIQPLAQGGSTQPRSEPASPEEAPAPAGDAE